MSLKSIEPLSALSTYQQLDPPIIFESTLIIRTYNTGSNPTRFPEESQDRHKR